MKNQTCSVTRAWCVIPLLCPTELHCCPKLSFPYTLNSRPKYLLEHQMWINLKNRTGRFINFLQTKSWCECVWVFSTKVVRNPPAQELNTINIMLFTAVLLMHVHLCARRKDEGDTWDCFEGKAVGMLLNSSRRAENHIDYCLYTVINSLAYPDLLT